MVCLLQVRTPDWSIQSYALQPGPTRSGLFLLWRTVAVRLVPGEAIPEALDSTFYPTVVKPIFRGEAVILVIVIDLHVLAAGT